MLDFLPPLNQLMNLNDNIDKAQKLNMSNKLSESAVCNNEVKFFCPLIICEMDKFICGRNFCRALIILSV